jgi:hypothetical protein
MKKLLIASTVALSLAATGVSAQENTAGAGASNAALGGLSTTTVVVGAYTLAAAAIIANADGSSTVSGPDPVVCEEGYTLVNGVCVKDEPPVCEDDEELVDGVCVPVTGPTVTSPTVTVTNTVD